MVETRRDGRLTLLLCRETMGSRLVTKLSKTVKSLGSEGKLRSTHTLVHNGSPYPLLIPSRGKPPTRDLHESGVSWIQKFVKKINRIKRDLPR